MTIRDIIENNKNGLHRYTGLWFIKSILSLARKLDLSRQQLLKLSKQYRNRVNKTCYIIFSAILIILPILGATGYTPFSRNANAAINQIRVIKYEEVINEERQQYSVKTGRVRRTDRGFNELLVVILEKQNLTIIPQDVIEIGLAMGNLPFGTMVSPNAVFYVIYMQENTKIFKPVIFHPFDPNITLNLGEVKGWIKEKNILRVHLIMLILVPIWTTFGILVTFRSR